MRGRHARRWAPETDHGIGARIADALRAGGHPRGFLTTSVAAVDSLGVLVMGDLVADSNTGAEFRVAAPEDYVDALVARLFEEEALKLVRLARLFVDDRNAAEDLVQEGFIRLARNAHRIQDQSKAAAYLRSIVLNLARDHNRRGLVSLRHHLPLDDRRASTEDEIVLRDDQQAVIAAIQQLPHRQRDCLVLRYYHELGIDDIASTLGISRNSVKTHLKRGLVAMETRLGVPPTEPVLVEVES